MKLVYSLLLFLSTSSLLFAQQTLSSFPIAIDKSDYDDRESVFITDENQGTGVFISDHSIVNFVKLEENGEASFTLKQNMPANYNSLKRVGAGTLNDNYICYFLQGNKKISMLQADVKSKTFTYSPFPQFTDREPILFLGAGAGYLYVVTTSGDAKNELTVYKYTSFGTPVITKVKTQDLDLYKSLGINPNKATEQIAVMMLNAPVHFTQSGIATKAYHSTDQLILTYDAPEGEVRVLKTNIDNPKIITISSGEMEKKNVFRSLVFKDQVFMLTVTSKSLTVKAASLNDPSQITDATSQLEPDFSYESSYSSRIGYNRERKATTKIELIKSLSRSDLAGLGLLETSNGKTVLVIGSTNKNNVSDSNMEVNDEQRGQLNVSITLDRNYYDLHLPSYAADQIALLKFKKEIWVYTYWILDEASGKLSKAYPEDVIALDESLDLFYRDPLNNVAPAVWKQDKNYLFGFYNAKNQTYSLYKMGGKPAGGNMNRR